MLIHIDAIINKGKDDTWIFTRVYGKPVTHLRHETWSLIQNLNNRFSIPWLCTRDFNELTSNLEKLGGATSNLEKLGGANRNQNQMQLFRNVIDECGFLDLGFFGTQFTWHKHFANGHLVWERLDRGLANNEWILQFRGTRVHHLHSNNSDHHPLWIVPVGLDPPCA